MYETFFGFCNFLSKSYSVLAAVMVFALSGLALAADESAVSVVMPDITWGTIASQIITALTSVAVVGIGVGISVWVLTLVPRLFKRSTK
jgi:uncharacterized integral membrane protein